MTSDLTDRSSQAEVRVVRPRHGVLDIGVLDKRHDRTKLLFIHNANAFLHVGKNRWLVKESLARAPVQFWLAKDRCSHQLVKAAKDRPLFAPASRWG